MTPNAAELILDPELPIIDPHHHLWDHSKRQPPPGTPVQHGFENVIRIVPRYLFDELNADMKRGHNIIGTVYMECGSMYRADGPAELAPVGETEFVNGVAAMSASGLYGPARACAGIVGTVDLMLGDKARAVLEAHLAAAGGRFRGIRHGAAWDADPKVLGPLANRPEGVYRDATFRQGFAHLGRLGLSFDAWMLEPQLPDLMDLAKAFPDTTIVLDHVGAPLGIGSYTGRRPERYSIWLKSIKALAALPNVNIKLGGLGMPFPGFESFMAGASSEALASEWRPYVVPCIEAFGPDRCMFESNFPVDLCSCTYDILWNALKRLAAGASATDKAALFAGTARRVYKLTI